MANVRDVLPSQRKGSKGTVLIFVGLFGVIMHPSSAGVSLAGEQQRPLRTTGYTYDYVTKKPLDASVATYLTSTPDGVDDLGCPKYKEKTDSKFASDADGSFSVEIGVRPFFTTSVCKPPNYASRTFIDQDSRKNQPWHSPRGISLIESQGNVEEQATAIESEFEDFMDDVVYLKQAAPKALEAALKRLSESRSEKKRTMAQVFLRIVQGMN